MVFKTDKKTSFKTSLFRHYINLYPAFRRTGGRVTFIAEDWSEVHLKLGLNWTTRNYVGTIFGGSMFAAADPIYMTQLMKILGGEYIVWDKSAKIRFVRPGTKTLYARFVIDEKILTHIRQEVSQHHQLDIELFVSWVDENQKIHARLEKTLYIADKAWFNQKKAK